MASFELQPTLRGERFELRPLRREDSPPLFLAASDPLIWEQHPNSDRYRPEAFKGFFDEAMASGGAFAVVDLRDGRLVGSSRFYDYEPARNSIVIGYTFLTREFWGGPANREVKTLMLNHAFRFVDQVLFHVGEHNLRSRRAMEKLGGEQDGRVEKANPDGTVRTNLVFRVRRARFGAS